MRQLWILLVAVLWIGATAPAFARDAEGQIVEVQIPAPSLAGNMLGTPTTQAGAIYLPPSYAHGHTHYPTLYMLHGIFDTHATWLDFIHIKAILDRDIAAHRIPEVIVIMADAANKYGGGFYRNSPVSGHWADFITEDVINFADQHYRTLARPGGRGLIGWSMGGFGAISIAMDRPGLYAAVYAISPCCLAPVEDLGATNDAWRRLLALHTQADLDAAAAHNDFYVLAAMGVLTSMSPAPDAPPFYVRMPFKEHDGQIAPDGAVYDRFLLQFPVYRVAETREALKSLRAFGFDYGINDQYTHIPPATRAFADRLAEFRIPHRFEVYDGDHRDHVAARLESIVLPYIAGALDKPE